MAATAGPMGNLAALQPHSVTEHRHIVRLLEVAQASEALLDCGLSRRIQRRTARISQVKALTLHLAQMSFDPEPGECLRVAFEVHGRPFCFETQVLSTSGGNCIAQLPRELSQGERRSRERLPANRSIELTAKGVPIQPAWLVDSSPEGVSIRAPDSESLFPGLHDLTVKRSENPEFGELRHKVPAAEPQGWVQLGIQLRPTPQTPVRKEGIEDLQASQRAPQRLRQHLGVTAAIVGAAIDKATRSFYASKLPSIDVVDFRDVKGLPLTGILDSWGDPEEAVAVVIPPAWGRTKETLLPLAFSIVSTFRRANRPVRVLRFDGIGKRGESYREPAARTPGLECLRMRFSQGVDDIRAAIRYLHSGPLAPPRHTMIVSFSASSIEARRAVAADDLVSGWVSVVGSADLQSMMKRISGGIDYALGIERGISFGRQEILGVTIDMDLAGRDALDHNLVYMSDSRQDMARISTPVTWVYGRADAWMDLEKVEDALSQGDSSNRRLVGTPMGHMLRSSREALSVFQFVANELLRMSGGKPQPRSFFDLAALARRQESERKRRPSSGVDLRQFWSNYLLGGEEGGGYEVLTSIAPFADFMKAQVSALEARENEIVLDIGSGTGSFLAYAQPTMPAARVIEADIVFGAMQRARADRPVDARCDYLQADLGGEGSFPLAGDSVDRVLASLFLSYVSDPGRVLEEIARVLRPGGRLVVSTLIKDADMSKLFMEGVEELREGRQLLAAGIPLDEALRRFTNHASHLLDLEEQGTFRFWERDELEALLEQKGWQIRSAQRQFGNPPQAIIVAADLHG